jgi:lysophospholipase L1-like esterase
VAVSLVVALAVAELLLRLTGLSPPQGTIFTVDQDEFDRIPGMLEPGASRLVHETAGLPYRASIDSLGYRGPDFPREPEPGEVRVLFIGDSVVFGSFVDDEHTLPSQLETLLRDRCSAPLRVVNAGLGGSTIRDHVEILRRSMDIAPRLVVLNFSENDIRDLIGPSMWLQLMENRRAKSRFPLRQVYPVVRHTALWNLALRVRGVLRNQRVDSALTGGDPLPPPGVGASPEDSPLVGPARERYRTLLAGLQQALADAGVPLVFAVFPAHHTVYGTWDSDQHEWAVTLGRSLGIETVSFLGPLRSDGRPETELYLLPLDGHPSAEGYRIAAEYLDEVLGVFPPFIEACG